MQRWVGRGVIADNLIMSASPSANSRSRIIVWLDFCAGK
jgi:hypothetical protein